jgi:hypothetical protein
VQALPSTTLIEDTPMNIRSVTLACVFGSIALACAGDDGKNGTVGPPGEAGVPGAKGDPGDPGPAGQTGATGATGEAGATGPAGPPGMGVDGGLKLPEGGLTTSCLSPCHGFNGTVEQWKTSRHYSTYVANLGGDEVETWTGARTCGNCHAIDGIEQRVAGNFAAGNPTHAANGQIGYLSGGEVTEASYGGQATVAAVSCSTCHDTSAGNDPHKTGQDYQPGSFPLRVPVGPTDEGWLEKSSAAGTADGTGTGNYGVGNVCMWCHKSRKDAVDYVTNTAVDGKITSRYWGPHEGPMADVFTGKGGYHFLADNQYAGSTHQTLENGCVACHMPDVAENQNVGNHSFYPQLSACTQSGCHVSATDFDVIGGQTAMKAQIQELREILNSAGYLSRATAQVAGPEGGLVWPSLSTGELGDDEFALDHSRVDITGITQDQAGALYNYLVIARGSAGGIHNPRYVRQLLFDSITAMGSTPSFPRPTGP